MIYRLLIVGVLLLVVSVTGCEKSFSITDVSPKLGNLAGGEPLEIIGSGFSAASGIAVYVGTNKVDNVSIMSPNKLMVSTPSGLDEGTVDIRVVLDNGDEYLISQVFTYVRSTGGGAMDIRELGERRSQRQRD